MARKTKTATQSLPAVTIHQSDNIPLNLLSLSSENIRTVYTDEQIETLAEDIARRGLLQSLHVRPIVDDNGAVTGTYEIPAGGRRFRALTLLVERKQLAADTPIPCVIKTDGVAKDDSLAENRNRVDLHPLDEFNAFAALVKQQKSAGDIAKAYKVTQAYVKQRMRLASASPVLLDAFRNDKLELEELEAFCITDNHEKQEAVFNGLTEGSQNYNFNPHGIRRLLTESTIALNDRRVTFVGLKAYRDAGGTLMRDLFQQDNGGYIQDPDILNRLVAEKLAAIGAEYVAQGWKWAETAERQNDLDVSGLDRLQPAPMSTEMEAKLSDCESKLETLYQQDDEDGAVQQQINALEAEIEAIRDVPPVYPDDHKARAGVTVTIGYNGEPQVVLGYIKPDDVPANEAPDEDEADMAAADDADEEDSSVLKPLSEKLKQDLTSFRTVAIRNALASDFQIAMVAVLHSLALRRFYHAAHDSCLQLTRIQEVPLSGDDLPNSKPQKDCDARDAEWKARLPKSAHDLWDYLLGMTKAKQQQLFAHCAAMQVNAVQMKFSSSSARHADQLVTALGLHMGTAGWTATADSYFGRVSKPHILAAVTDARGEETANLIAHLKKSDMATEAERLLQGTGWLPELLRTPLAPDTDEGKPRDDALPEFLADTAGYSGPDQPAATA